MQNSVHGHEVLRMMMAAESGWTRGGLEAAISDRFGADTRFHTCSAHGMTGPELLDFLEARGKFVPVDGGFNTAPDRVCDHE